MEITDQLFVSEDLYCRQRAVLEAWLGSLHQ